MTTMTPEAVARLRKDVREASATLSDREARFLVDAYYQMQEHRIETQNQVRALTTSEEPNAILQWLFDQHYVIEKEIAKVLGDFTDNSEAGVWAKSILGIGPIIAAGMLAHIDITRAPTVGHIWRYAGYDPTVRWEKGQKRPWNAALKVVCWKAGESFVKVSGRPCLPGTERAAGPESTESSELSDEAESTVIRELPKCLDGCANYGHMYLHRKALETARNEAGEYREQAERTLLEKKIGKDTDAYKAYSKGLLPKARIHARSKRYAVKLYLSHFHHVLHVTVLGEAPPKPYVITQLEHVHYLKPPNWPLPSR